LLSGCGREPPGPYSDGVAKGKYVATYKKDCALNKGRGCEFLYVAYWHGFGVKQDKSKAVKYFTKACIQNNGIGCISGGKYFRQSRSRGPYSYVQGEYVTTYEKDCALNDGRGCSFLAATYSHRAARSYRLDVKTKNYSNAVKYYSKACKLNDGSGCTRLGQKYKYGKGVKKDLSKAIMYMRKGCDLNHGLGCSFLGNIYRNGPNKDESKAKMYYRKACKLGIMDVCWWAKYLPLP